MIRSRSRLLTTARITRSLLRLRWRAALLIALAIGGAPGNVVAATQCVAPPDGLIDWWPGDGNATDIGGHHTGTAQNGVTFVTGQVGQAFELDATQHRYVDVGLIALPATFTLSAGINPSQSSNGEIINSFDLESAVLITLAPGNYTAILSGVQRNRQRPHRSLRGELKPRIVVRSVDNELSAARPSVISAKWLARQKTARGTKSSPSFCSLPARFSSSR